MIDINCARTPFVHFSLQFPTVLTTKVNTYNNIDSFPYSPVSVCLYCGVCHSDKVQYKPASQFTYYRYMAINFKVR